MSEIKSVARVLTDKKVNSLQVNSIQRLIDRAKHAHYVNVYLRINGQDEHYEADWLKHLTMNADALAAAREEGRRAGLEEAAQVCGDQVDPHPERHFDEGYNQAVRDCIDSIRALKEKP